MMNNNNYTFSDSFFKHIKAPGYKLEVVNSDVQSIAVFPSLDRVLFQFVGLPGWQSARDIGATVNKVEVQEVEGGNAYATMWLKLPESLPNVLAVMGAIIPESMIGQVSPWDTMGMDGNLHSIEGYEPVTDGYVQVIHSSRYSHDGNGEPHPDYIRFGVVFPGPLLPAGIGDGTRITYTVDFQHICLKGMEGNENVLSSLNGLCWPGTWDFSILHRPAGTYTVDNFGKYILLRCL